MKKERTDMRDGRRTLMLRLALAAVQADLLRPEPAFAYLYYVGDEGPGMKVMRKHLHDTSRIVRSLKSSDVVDIRRDRRDHGGWVRVQLWWGQFQGARPEDFRRNKPGWIRRKEITGECED
jgi:hypothetical protein